MGRQATDIWNEKSIKCPFYKSMDKKQQRISCEGAIKGTRSDTYFKTRLGYEKHLDRYCGTFEYEKCPVFGMVYTTKYKQ